MANPINSSEFNLSLIQQREQKRAIVEKMRGKLAGHPQAGLRVEGKKRASAHKSALALGWKLALGAVLLACAVVWYPRGKTPAPIAASLKPSARTLPGPSEKFGIDEQALYWTYALYDFDRLKVSYGVPGHSLIDAGLAAERLRALMPKVNARTRFIIDGYMTNDRRKT